MPLFRSIRSWLLALLVIPGFSGPAHAAAPAAPTDCSAKAILSNGTTASIAITWADNSTNETAWQVKYTIDGVSGDFSLNGGNITTTTPGTTGNVTYNWPGASANRVYRFRVIANNVATISDASNVATVGTYPLSAPINLKVTVVDPFNVTLSWEEQSYSEAGFAIEGKVGTGAWTYLDHTASNSLSIATQNWIWPWQTFTFRVRAFTGSVPTEPDVGGANVSGYSNEAPVSASAYTLAAATVAGQAAVNLSWPNIQNEDGYHIFQVLYDGNGNRDDALIGEVAANVTTYQAMAPTIEPAKTCRFYVRPYSGEYYIGSSSVATVTLDGITSNSRIAGIPGSALAHAFTHVSGSTVGSRTLTGTPETLTFNAVTGELTGVFPPALGNHALLYTVNFTDGSSLSQTFDVLVRPAAGPPVVATTIPAWSGMAGATRNTPLAGTFTDPEAESAVRVSTTLGNMDFILFDTATPATVANFMNYVNAGKYTEVVFHRSISNFVIQAGGFTGTGTGSNFTSVATDAPVINEPGIANERGTVSMAKLGGDPNSATSQFFVSLADNRANLDYQNGGFTVFGRVAGNGMSVADAISALPKGTYNLLLDGGTTATPFEDFPMHAATAPPAMDQTQLMKINSVTSIPTLTYSLTGNTHPEVATATIVNGQLHLVGLTGGHTTLTLTATDLDNLTATQTVEVDISDYATWAAAFADPALTDTAANADPDHDGLDNLLEYVFGTDPRIPNQGGPSLAMDASDLILSFKRKDSSETSDVTLQVQVSTDLTDWSTIYNIGADTATSSAGVTVLEDGANDDLITVTIPKGIDAQKFVRLVATTTHTAPVVSDTYSTWAARTTFPGGQNGAEQNPDGDSLTNFQEYAFLGDPAIASQAPLPTLGVTGVVPAPQFMTLTFAVRKATTGLSYIVEANDSLSGTWSEVWKSADDPAFGHAQVLSFTDQADRTVVTIKDSAAMSGQSQRFMRLKVVQN